MSYEVPKKHYFRLHHVRPRFKNNIEEVLLYIADAITTEGNGKNEKDFNSFVIDKIYNFKGNASKKLKTIQNWRTEISALFGLYYVKSNLAYSSKLANDLSENQDLTKFFKYFLYTFQYPAPHIKMKEVEIIRQEKILFHPAKYIIKTLSKLKLSNKSNGYITKAESCHLIFNDKRVTTDSKMKNIDELCERILLNRKNNVEYDMSGDVIRYAGDILDYMGLANLLKDFGGKFYLNSAEKKSLKKFTDISQYFENRSSEEEAYRENWVEFTNLAIEKEIFETDILAFIAESDIEYKELVKRTNYITHSEIPTTGVRTKDIGDYGENLVYGHECMDLKRNKREDLIHLVKCIPNVFAVGYDIQSVFPSEMKKYIEVKSTISQKQITFKKFHLTLNELNSAQTLRENYYVYRLKINKSENDLYVKLWKIKDPIGLFKRDEIEINLSTGEVNLRQYEGEEEELLRWDG